MTIMQPSVETPGASPDDDDGRGIHEEGNGVEECKLTGPPPWVCDLVDLLRAKTDFPRHKWGGHINP